MSKKTVDEKPSVEPVKYSDVELQYRESLIRKIEKARDTREKSHIEFDGQKYTEFYVSNAKAANSYIPPKTNKSDTRLTTGTTHEKKNTLLASLLNFNLEPTIIAYDDEDRVIYELGQIQQDLVRKSRQMETPNYDEKRLPIYNELLTQGTVNVEEAYIQYKIPNKDLDDFSDFSKIDSVTWKERLTKTQGLCQSQLLCGLNVYYGNFKEPHIELQPFIFTSRIRHRNEMEALYGGWDRWKNVPYKKTMYLDDNSNNVSYNDWSLETYEEDYVEELKFQDKWGNNFMIILNGVMMFPVKKHNGRFSTMPLSALLGVRGKYTIAKEVLDPIDHCAYGRSIPSKMKVDQAVFDEMLQMVVSKTRQSYKPPLANLSGKQLSKRIYEAGYITNDVRPEQIKELGKHNGVTIPEFNAISFIKQIIDGKSVSPIMEGQEPSTKATATQITAQKQQSMLKMGLSIYAAINLEKQMAELRLFNILKNWTEPTGEVEGVRNGVKQIVNQYRSLSVKTNLEEGQEGMRDIIFTEDELPSPEKIRAQEAALKEATGREVRRNYINPKVLKSLAYTYHIEVVPTEKETSELKAALFSEYMGQSIEIGMKLGKMPNTDYLLTRHAVLNGEDPDKVWPAGPVPGALGVTGLTPGEEPPGTTGPIGRQLTQQAQGVSNIANQNA